MKSELKNCLISVNAVHAGQTKITGVCKKGSDYQVFASNNNMMISKRENVNNDGTFSLSIPPQLEGQLLTVYLYHDKNGGSFEFSIALVVEAAELDKITSVEDYWLFSDLDGFIRGTYRGPNATKIFLTIDGVDTAILTINPGEGEFQYFLANLPIDVLSEVFISIVDKEEKILDTQKLKIVP